MPHGYAGPVHLALNWRIGSKQVVLEAAHPGTPIGVLVVYILPLLGWSNALPGRRQRESLGVLV